MHERDEHGGRYNAATAIKNSPRHLVVRLIYLQFS